MDSDQQPTNSNEPSISRQPTEDQLTAILFETSPYGTIDAIVQHDDRAVYFYLNGDETFGTRACWVRNLLEAPYVINQQDLEKGIPPLMPRTHCRDKSPQPIPLADQLSVIWLEEGNGAALFEQERLIAVIPPWSGIDGFHGYSVECVAEHSIGWPLPQNDQLLLRIDNAKKFWQSCSSEDNHPFAQLQPKLLEVYSQAFSTEGHYYSLDGGQFPPRGAIIMKLKSETVIASVGMSIRPQPGVELAVEDPRDQRRIELALKIPSNTSAATLETILKKFSGLVSFPWQAQTWLGHGHTIDFQELASCYGEEVTAAAIVNARESKLIHELKLPDFRGDPVHLLQLVPVSTAQLEKLKTREITLQQLPN